ncbi:MAG: TspO/MBR family protein [Pirellulaceae bacterium]|nr:TspO/MBR family protein [Pirellulaceae bacterium]
MHSENQTASATPSDAAPAIAWQVLALAALVGLTLAAAGVGGAVTSSSVGTWYQTLQKPAWNPPDWIFGPVWTVLYLLMAIAAWQVYRRNGIRAATLPLALFGLQLALNIGWSAIFFGLRSPGLAFAEIVFLWLAIAATALSFWPHSRLATVLLAPYLAWTTFAAALNLTIWRMNG